MKKIITIIALSFSLGANAQNIYTLAGNGTQGNSGNGTAATAAELNNPNGIATDAAGNVYIVDFSNNAIRIVNTAGIISIFAGNGTAGYSGDGAAAISAALNAPVSIVTDAAGNAYITDQDNNAIRIVNTAGIISTFAGNGINGYSGDNGAATAAELAYPYGVTVDANGNVYIADQYNSRIRKVNTAGIISTVAGNGTNSYSGDGGAATAAGLFAPYGIAVDGIGNMYIADYYNQRIRKVNTAGIISTLAGNGTSSYSGDGGSATAAELNDPAGVAVDAGGNVYIADQGNNVIRIVNTAGIISTFAGNGTAGYSGDGAAAISAELSSPASIAIDAAGNVYIADDNNNVIRAVSRAPTANSVAICMGSTTTLTATGGASYVWAPATGLSATTGASVAANPTVTTTYTISCGAITNTVNNVAITSTGITLATVSVNPVPVISSQSGSVKVCGDSVNKSFTVNSPGSNTYQWYWNSGAGTLIPSGGTADDGTYGETNYATNNMTVFATQFVWGPSGTQGVYCVVTNTNNCIATTAFDTIFFSPVPTVSLTTIQPTCSGLCNGMAFAHVSGGSGLYTYTWTASVSIDSMITNICPSGTQYMVTVTDANTLCSQSVNFSIASPAPIQVQNITTLGTGCAGSSDTVKVHLSAGGGASPVSYTWSPSASLSASTGTFSPSTHSSSVIATPTATTNYTITIVDANNCMITDTISVHANNCAGIEQVSGNNNQVTVYPNPNNGSFVITTTENTNTITATDILGNELVSVTPTSTTTNINLSAQPSGIYFIKVIANGAQTVKRIIINN